MKLTKIFSALVLLATVALGFNAHASQFVSYTSTTVITSNSSSVLLSVPVPVNQLVDIDATITGYAGGGANIAVTYVPSTGVFTATNGSFYLPTGTPVTVTSSDGYQNMFSGISTNLTLYAGNTNSTTFNLYTNQAQAIASGATGKLISTGGTVGTNVYIAPSTLNAFLKFKTVAKNLNGNIFTIGTTNTVTAFKDVAAWDVYVLTNSTSISLKGLSDAGLTTTFVVRASETVYGLTE